MTTRLVFEDANANESVRECYGICDGCGCNNGESSKNGKLFCERVYRSVNRADYCSLFKTRVYPYGYDVSKIPKLYAKFSDGVPVAYRYGYEYEAMALVVDGGYETAEDAINAFYADYGNKYNTLDISNALDFLNEYRNLHYADSSNTESYKLADAINTILPVFVKMRERLM